MQKAGARAGGLLSARSSAQGRTKRHCVTARGGRRQTGVTVVSSTGATGNLNGAIQNANSIIFKK